MPGPFLFETFGAVWEWEELTESAQGLSKAGQEERFWRQLAFCFRRKEP